MKTTLQRTTTLASAALLLLAGTGSALHAQTPLLRVVRSDGSPVLIANDNGRIGIGLTNPQRALDIATAGGIRLSRTEFASELNEIYFQDNGQIRSRDNNHRIIFDRANDVMELREFGRIILSAGATSGQRTGTMEVSGTEVLVNRRLHVASGDGMLAGGSRGSGAIAPTGAGTRMLWYPRKAAFRAGGVFGSQWDDASIGAYSVAMGESTTARGPNSTAMGRWTTASGENSTAMGSRTTASGSASTAMGAGTWATGVSSTAIGEQTIASGHHSTALGTWASTNDFLGAFVYGDATFTNVVTATAPHQFVVRASGGFRFRTAPDLGTGCDLPSGSGSWSCTSSRHLKQDFRSEDGESVLRKIAAMPIPSWSYTGEPGDVRHLGPTAQDFHAAFGLGTDDTTIGMLDIAGVNLIAVQALERRTRELREAQDRLRQETQRVEALERRAAELERRLARLEARPGGR
jgi:hypothetical protein